MAITNTGKDVIWVEQSGSATHVKHSAAVTVNPVLASTGTTALTLTQPTPAFAVGEQVQLRDSTKTAKAIVTASGVGSVTIQPYFGTGDVGSPSGATFTSATLESVFATPTRALTLTIDLTDAPPGTTYNYLILATGNISQSAATNVSKAWLRSKPTAADPYAGTSSIGLMAATHTNLSTHNFVASRREASLAAGSSYLFTLEFAADDTLGGTATMQYGGMLAIRYATVTASSTNGDGAEYTTTSTTFQEAATLGSNTLAAGTYLIVATAGVGTSSTSDDPQLRLVTDSTAATKIAESRYKADATTDYYPFSYVGVKTLTAANQVRLQLARTSTTATVKAANIQLCAIPLPSYFAGVASSDFTGQTATTISTSGSFNVLKQSASVLLSQGSHIEIVSAGITGTVATTFSPAWDTSLTFFGTRYQGGIYSATQYYGTSWFRSRARSGGSTANSILAAVSSAGQASTIQPQFYWLRQATFPDPGLESKPASAALGNVNFLRTATVVSSTSAATNYPARYLLSDHRTRRWRSTSSGTAQQVVFDLGSARLPTMLALVDYNGTTGNIRLESSSNSTFTADLQTYTFWTATQSDNAKVQCFYPASDNWGSAPTARQYWRLTLPAGATTDAYHEVGSIWLGTYEPFDYVSSLSVDVQDESPVAEARAGARYVDQFRPFASVSLSVEYLGLGAAQALRDRLLTLRQNPVIIDVHAVSSATGLYPYGRFYGYLDPGGISSDLKGGNENTVSLSVIEARG